MIRNRGAGAAWALCVLFALVPQAAPAAVDVESFVKREQFRDVQVSPGGTYLAATLPMEDRTGLVILRLSDRKVTAKFSLGRNTDIAWFQWVNDGRVLLGVADKFGMLARPRATGEIVGLDAEGGKGEMLVGQRVEGGGAGTRIQQRKPELVWARLTDDLPQDDRNVILTVASFDDDAYTRAEKMDVLSGRRVVVARVPVRNASFTTDHQGVVRLAMGADGDNLSRVYYRAGDDAEWTLVNSESASKRRETPLGFSADGKSVYLRSDQPDGPDSIVAWDVDSGQRREVLRDDAVDPYEVIYASSGPREPIGALFMDGRPRTAFFKADHPDARLQRMLEQAFDGELVRITSRTADGRLALVLTSSDRNSGDFFQFDTSAKKAGHLLSRRAWLDPLAMAETRPVLLRARDGLPLHGYLTLPRGAEGKGLPLVLLPHGGPYGVQDTWEFGEEQQLLAAAGYAVLQVNYRGSGGYGHRFEQAGARQWGRSMQDDLTDATRWAIAEGLADPSRVCIYGASYGAYAALMGVAREPALYRCAAGYVGVYDLATRSRALAGGARSTETWSEDWLGSDPAELAATSPNRQAASIRVPVFLAAGGEDEITPVVHTRMMERALIAAGVPVQTLYYPTEGHGFYSVPHRVEYYGQLLDFLDRHIGASRPR
ncbi:S9 family peptidase [Pseudoxanthomonas sp. Soil82]|uniref:alpha/beta hydrolase family protein n=1 Tax=Pseudoxanthomonas sp. Soil82 TaxID=3157341 RepID=UPI00338D66FE